MSNVIKTKIVTCPICGAKITSYKKVGSYFCRRCRNDIVVYNLDEYTNAEITEIHDMFTKSKKVLEESCISEITDIELIEMTLKVFDENKKTKEI